MAVLDEVVDALFAAEVTGEPARLSKLIEPVLPAGDDLVHVPLVAGVPENRILGRFEHAMQCQRQFDGAEVRAEVAACFGNCLHDEVADLAGQVVELRVAQRWIDGRQHRFDFFEYR